MEKFDVSRRVYVAEIDLSLLNAAATEIQSVRELPRFPAVTRDIALLTDECVQVGDLMDAIRTAGGKNLEDVRLFDVYRGDRLGAGKKSVAFAMAFRANDRTLTDEEIASSMNKIQAACAKLGAQIRQ